MHAPVGRWRKFRHITLTYHIKPDAQQGEARRRKEEKMIINCNKPGDGCSETAWLILFARLSYEATMYGRVGFFLHPQPDTRSALDPTLPPRSSSDSLRKSSIFTFCCLVNRFQIRDILLKNLKLFGGYCSIGVKHVACIYLYLFTSFSCYQHRVVLG